MKKQRKPTILVLEGLSGSAGCIRAAGGVPVTVNPRYLDEVDDIIAEGSHDGLLLTGGGDIDPRLYGERPHKKVYAVSENRDLTEQWALDEAREAGIPVLGICRGAQMICVEAGGSLRQHFSGHRGGTHPIKTVEGSIMRETVGERVSQVVSLHHQHVLRIPNGHVVTSYAYDGTPESIESTDGRCLGVQFHPEMDRGRSYSKAIFRWLVAESARRAGLPVPEPVWSLSSMQSSSPNRAGARSVKRKRVIPPSLQNVRVSWMCPVDGIRFDNLDDRDDHILLLHPDHAHLTRKELLK